MKTIVITESQLNEIKGFHGSKNNFTRFDHRHFLSSGCGNQAFGWGTYVTDDIEVAIGYCKNFNQQSKQSNVYYKGENILKAKNNPFKDVILALTNNDYELTFYICKIVKNELMSTKYNIDEFLSYIEKSLHKESNYLRNLNNNTDFDEAFLKMAFEDAKKRILAFQIILKAFDEGFIDDEEITFNTNENSFLYTVDIPDDNGTNYLYWYEEIPDKEFRKIASNLDKLPNRFKKNLSAGFSNFNAETFTDDVNFERAKEFGFPTFFGKITQGGIKVSGMNIYNGLVKLLGSGKAASLFLGYCGYVGIKYPTYTRWSRPEDNDKMGNNYVIFNSNNIKITKVEENSDL